MATGYSIQRRGAEKEALDRWENEGGRLDEDYLRHMDQGMPVGRRGPRHETPHVNLRVGGRFEL